MMIVKRKDILEPLFCSSLALIIFAKLCFLCVVILPAMPPAYPNIQCIYFSFHMNSSKPKIHAFLHLVIFAEWYFLEVILCQHTWASFMIFTDCAVLDCMDTPWFPQSLPTADVYGLQLLWCYEQYCPTLCEVLE